MKKVLLAIAYILISVSVFSQNDQKLNNSVVSATVDVLDNDKYVFDIGYHYMFNNYVGAGALVGVWKESSKIYKYSINGDEPISRFFVSPSVLLNTPYFLSNKVCRFNVGAEIDLLCNKKFSKTIYEYDFSLGGPQNYSYSSKPFSLVSQVGLNVVFDHLIVGAGYSISSIELTKKYDNSYPQPFRNRMLTGFYLTSKIRF